MTDCARKISVRWHRVQQSGFTRWPPRLPEQPIFYPVTNEAYAKQIAIEWNIAGRGVGYVTRFHVRESFMDRYPRQKVGGDMHTEWWIPAEELESLNDNIVGSYFGTASGAKCRRTVFTAQPTSAAICRRLNPCLLAN